MFDSLLNEINLLTVSIDNRLKMYVPIEIAC